MLAQSCACEARLRYTYEANFDFLPALIRIERTGVAKAFGGTRTAHRVTLPHFWPLSHLISCQLDPLPGRSLATLLGLVSMSPYIPSCSSFLIQYLLIRYLAGVFRYLGYRAWRTVGFCFANERASRAQLLRTMLSWKPFRRLASFHFLLRLLPAFCSVIAGADRILCRNSKRPPWPHCLPSGDIVRRSSV